MTIRTFTVAVCAFAALAMTVVAISTPPSLSTLLLIFGITGFVVFGGLVALDGEDIEEFFDHSREEDF